MNSNFEELLLQITKANLVMTSQSLDKAYDLIEHLCEFGSLYDYAELKPEYSMGLLAAMFATARNHVIVNEQLD